MDPDPIKLISSSAQWKMEFFNQANPASYKSKYLKYLPYAVIEKIKNIMANNWANWEPQALKLFERNMLGALNADTLISHLCTSGYKIENLFSMATRAKCTTLEKYIFPSVSKKEKCLLNEAKRYQADNDFSKGFLRDIYPKSLIELAAKLWDNAKWRRLGDAFGFDQGTCLNFQYPLDMLKKWMLSQSNINAKPTICRLYYEAEKIGALSVCNYLDAIPLEGVAEIEIFPQEASWKNRYATRFDIKRLDEIFKEVGLSIPWNQMVKKLVRTDNEFVITPNEAIWWTGDTDMNELLNQFQNCNEAQICIQKFKAEIEDGSFEPISPGGISYGKMKYLAKSIQDAFDLHSKSQKNDRFFHNLALKLPKILRRNGSMNAEKFICIYWQVHQACDLDVFCQSLEKMLPRKLSEAVELAYRYIKPWRQYDPDLAAENLKRNVKTKARNIDDFIGQALDRIYPDTTAVDTSREVAPSTQCVEPGAKEVTVKEQKAKKDLCVICIDKKIKALAVPCGHYAFCLDCIQKIKTCSLCQSEITHKVEVYPSGVAGGLN